MNVTAVWVVVLLLVAGCSSKLDKVRDQFIDSCVGSGAPLSTCTCAIDELQERYGEKGLVAIEERGYPPPGFLDQLAEAAQQCRKQSRN
ncbi:MULTISPECIES: hypothetical protein [Xanthomonas]|uniref:hypothetical protein n=1 Tax=Xanthomonas TaxID=338 RepID=UPI001CD8D841|nr:MULTISPECIES: hypothetical protein [Xanthomonas]